MIGEVLSVEIAYAGTELVGAHLSGVTVLHVVDVSEFPESGTALAPGAVLLPFIAITSTEDPDSTAPNDTVVLAGALATGLADKARILVSPLREHKIALVQFDTEADPVECLVRHSLHDKFAEGPRNIDQGETVECSQRPESMVWVIDDILGKRPSVDGQYLAVSTVVGAAVNQSDFAAAAIVPLVLNATDTTVDPLMNVGINNVSGTFRLRRDGTGEWPGLTTVPPVIAAAITAGAAGALLAANNLSDLASAATARTNLGLGTAATHATTDYDATGLAAAAQSAAIAASNQRASNLSDVASAATARTNLGLGTAATQATGAFDAAGAAAAAQAAAIAASDTLGAATAAQAAAIAASAQRASNLSDLASAFTSRANLGLGTAAVHANGDYDASGAAASAITTAEAYSDAHMFAALPSWHGLKAWTLDPACCNGSAIIATAGVLNFAKIWTPGSIAVTSIWVQLTGTATLTNVGFGLWSAAGVLLQSSINANGATTTAFSTSGTKQVTITSQIFAAGVGFYVGFWFTGSAMPTFIRSSGFGTGNINLASPNLRFGVADTGLTTTAPSTMATQVGTANNNLWVGVS